MNAVYACIEADYSHYNYHYSDGNITYTRIDPVINFSNIGFEESTATTSETREVIDTYSVSEFVEGHSLSITVSVVLTLFLVFGLVYMFKNWKNVSSKRKVLIPLLFGTLWLIGIYMTRVIMSTSCGTPSVSYTSSSLIFNFGKALYISLPILYLMSFIVFLYRYNDKSKK